MATFRFNTDNVSLAQNYHHLISCCGVKWTLENVLQLSENIPVYYHPTVTSVSDNKISGSNFRLDGDIISINGQCGFSSSSSISRSSTRSGIYLLSYNRILNRLY